MMINSYIKIAWRNLSRNKVFSLINIFGLAMGLAACILIALFVVDELSYDKHNLKADRIYRINTEIHINNSDFNDRVTPAPMSAVLTKDFPQIEKSVRIVGSGNMLVKMGAETISESNGYSADSSIFDVFTIPMIAGDQKTALTQPNSIVISEAFAEKYFKSKDVLGKTLIVDNTTSCKITGIIKNLPLQSHIHFNFIKSLAGVEEAKSDFWLNNNYATYILVRSGTSRIMVDRYLKEVAKKYAEPQLVNFYKSSFQDLEKRGDHFRYTGIPLTDIHLHSTLGNELEPSGNIQYVYIFIVIAIFILVIACVNFMNLSTARSASRSREVGVRKVMGSNRFELILQFLTESVITSFIALTLGVFFAILLLPYLNEISGKQIALYDFSSFQIPAALLTATFLVGLLAGSYPAFFLSSFAPIQVLKGKLSTGFRASWLRNGLVVFQFVAAIVLIIGTLVIYSQLNYIRTRNIGYNREQVMVLRNAFSLGGHAATFKNEVLQIPGITAATRLGSLPTSNYSDGNRNAYSRDASLSASQTLTLADWSVDADYIPAMGMQIVAGRNFSPSMVTDSNAMIINETAARVLGFKDPLQGKLFDLNRTANKVESYSIIGVVKDFNAGSLRYNIEPVIFRLSKYGDRFAFRIRSNNVQSVVKQVESRYHAMPGMAGQPFLYSFMDDDFNRLYQVEQQTGKIFMSFAFFAIIIACLGLFGLVTYAAEQRTKEVGIRKVLGASVGNIVRLLSYDFIKLVLIAAIIAFPLGWLVMTYWLKEFAFRTEIGWWIYGISAFIAFFITMATTSHQAVKAAMINPVKSLKTE